MTAFTRVRMDHHLQPTAALLHPSTSHLSLHLSLPPNIALFISLALSVRLAPSFFPLLPPCLSSPLILFSDSITLHFDNPAA